MKIKYFENIVKYLPVLIVCLLIGILGRLHFIKKGADEFTVNVIFAIFTGFGISFYALINIFLNEIIEKATKIFFKKESSEFVENQNVSNENLEYIREKQNLLKQEKQQTQLNIAVAYTQNQMALYTTDEDLRTLCYNLKIYAENLDFESLKSIGVKNLSTLDIYHFGWNIWNHFKVNNQLKTAHFLKTVFPRTLKDVEVESIKRHLKDDEQKGIITITDNLSEF